MLLTDFTQFGKSKVVFRSKLKQPGIQIYIMKTFLYSRTQKTGLDRNLPYRMLLGSKNVQGKSI